MEPKVIIYDFDGTLTPFKMPRFEIIEKCGIKDYYTNPLFKELISQKLLDKDVDYYKAVYITYLEVIREKGFKLKDSNFCLGAQSVIYNDGVEDFLQYLVNKNVKNYVISSGIKVFLQNTNVAKYFSDIYGTEFEYDDNNEAIGLKYIMTDKNKVDYIKEIIKNEKIEDLSNVIYIGDGFTDRYAMEYVTNSGGTSIYVYQEKEEIDGMHDMDEIVSLYTKADYSDGSELNKYIREKLNI